LGYSPVGTRSPYTYQQIVLEDGDSLFFDRVSKGTGYEDAVFRHTETATRFYKAVQRWNGNGWTTRLADGSEILFPESYNAKNMAQGAPTEIRNAKGDRLELIRDPQRNLTEIRTPHGHWIRFTYDGLSRIIRAEDDARHWAQYGYNENGMLDVAGLSSGRQRHCEYDGVRMTAITDESGRSLLRNWYNSGQLVRQQFDDGAVYSYRYDLSASRTYYERAYVTFLDQSTQVIALPDYIAEIEKNPR
jgi:YD repeat-containing protein